MKLWPALTAYLWPSCFSTGIEILQSFSSGGQAHLCHHLRQQDDQFTFQMRLIQSKYVNIMNQTFRQLSHPMMSYHHTLPVFSTSVSFRFFETGWLTSLSLTVTNLKSSARWPAVNCEISGPYKSLIESQRCQRKARRHNCTTCNINKFQDTLKINPQGLGTQVCQVPCSQTNAARATCSSYNFFQLEFPEGKSLRI